MRTRARVVQAWLAAAMALLVAAHAQVVFRSGPVLAARGLDNARRALPIAPLKGDIFDRQGLRLAGSRTALALVLADLSPAVADAALPALAAALAADPAEQGEWLQRWQGALAAARAARTLPVTLVPALTPAQHARLLAAGLPAGAFIFPGPERDYPYGSLAAHVLDGLERHYARTLAGTPGQRFLAVDARGRLRAEPQERGPQPGLSLHLGLDAALQAQVEWDLDEHLRWIGRVSGGEFRPRRGAVVVLDLRTGAVLALASHPGYDPNAFVRGLTPAGWSALAADPAQPLNNWALAAFPPGSTYKMVTALAALAAGAVTPDEQVHCAGRYWALHRPGDWKPEGHGDVNLTRGLAQSCDIYFYELGNRVGAAALQEMARTFGLGRPTGIDLPGEAAGQAAGPAEYGSRWQPGEVLSLAIGQGRTLVTPLQLAVYTGALATGRVVTPYLVQAVRAPGGEAVFERAPAARPLPLAPAHLAAVRAGMREVAHGPQGTAAWAFEGFPVAVGAKTGTAEDPPRPDVAWTVAFAPYDRPEIAVVAVIPGGGHGSWAAPVVRAAMAAYFGLPAGDAWPPAMRWWQ